MEWVNKPLPGYKEAINSYVETAKDEILKEFLLSHAEAAHRVRTAALQLAMVDNLDKIALDTTTPPTSESAQKSSFLLYRPFSAYFTWTKPFHTQFLGLLLFTLILANKQEHTV